MVKSVFASLLLLLSISSHHSVADDHSGTYLEVIDTFAEMHSGPGRGYPVFYVIEQGEKIEVLTRRPGWYEVRTERGKVGWTTTAQISRTIQGTGEPADLPSVGYGDYIKNSFVTGFSMGQFGSGDLDSYELISVNIGYRFLPWLGVDVERGRFYDESGESGDLTVGNIFVEPFSDWKVSPYLGVSSGTMKFSSAATGTRISQSGSVSSYALGVSYYLGRNFVVKGEYRFFSMPSEISDKNTEALKIGFNTFF